MDNERFWEDLTNGKIKTKIREVSKGKQINNSTVLHEVMKHFFDGLLVEKMFGVFLDSKNRVICIKEISSGSISSCSVYPREVIRMVMKHNAAALIMVHNHPSGIPDPSKEDINITTRIYLACNSINVALHEHMIVGDENYVSLSDTGVIKNIHDKIDKFFYEG